MSYVIASMASTVLGQMRGREVAVKTLTSENSESRQGFLREAENMNKYRHPNLVEFVCVSYNERDNKLYLVSELMAGGDLHAFLSKRRKANVRFHINYMLKIALQVKRLKSFCWGELSLFAHERKAYLH